MKHSLPYGSLDLPDDWEDRTTYQFVSPARGPDVPLAVGVEISKTRVSVLLSRIGLQPEADIEGLVRHEMEELRKAVAGLKVINLSPWQHPVCGLVQTIDMTFEIGAGQEVHQLQFYFRLSEINTCICLTISSSAVQFVSEKDHIKRIFEGFIPVK